MQLPPRSGSRPIPQLPKGTRRIIVIGANGAGKTRFARHLQSELGEQALSVSALNAIYGVRDTHGPVRETYEARVKTAPMMRHDLTSEFDQLIALLLDEEMTALLNQKYNAEEADFEQTHLEHLSHLWHDLFPDNRIMIERGTILFANNSGPDGIRPARLSDGEKAIIYYLGAALMARKGLVMMVENPTMFLNRSMMSRIWDMVEEIRGNAGMVYVTHDLDFASDRIERGDTVVVWVRRYFADAGVWDYDILPPDRQISDEVYLALMGARKPVMFIEGDAIHSIDGRLYPLVFKEYTVRPLGGCDRVIEATRTFNDLNALHNLDSIGIVDRDRRSEQEVDYLRNRRIMVPDVAEIENLLMLEDVIKSVAAANSREPEKAFKKVKRAVMQMFAAEIEQQALQHTRHRVKVAVQHCIDRRFTDINQLEKHMLALVREIRPRHIYVEACRAFTRMVEQGDYAGVLLVFNRKSMLAESGVAAACGVRGTDREAYLRAILTILKNGGHYADRIAQAVKRAFRFENEPLPETATKCRKKRQSKDESTR